MLTAIAIASWMCSPGPTSRPALPSGAPTAKQSVTMEARHVSLYDALREALKQARARYRFEPGADVIAKRLRRTASFKNVPVEAAVHALTQDNASKILRYRLYKGTYVFSVPMISVEMERVTAAQAFQETFERMGVSYVIRMDGMNNALTKIKFGPVTPEQAIRHLVKALPGQTGITVRLYGTVYAVGVQAQRNDYDVLRTTQVAADLDAVDARDALRAIFGVVDLNFTAALPARKDLTVQANADSWRTVLEKTLIAYGDLTYRVDNGVYEIVRKRKVSWEE
jgi:hypothetical protein